MPLQSKYKPITIERKSGGSFQPISWTTISAATDKGYIQRTSGSESFETGKAGDRADYRMFVPMDNTALQYGDRIIQSSQIYIVLDYIQPDGISGESHHKEIALGVFE